MTGKDIPGYFEIWDTMISRSLEQDDLLYSPYDSHWNRLGASVAAEIIIEGLRPGTWEAQSLIDHGMSEFPSDLERLAGLDGFMQTHDITVERDGVTVQTTKVSSDFWTIVDYTSTSDEHYLLPPAVIFNDSFGTALKAVLPPYFEKISFVHISRFQHNLPAVQERFDEAEIVIVESVERSMYVAFPGFLMKNLVNNL